MPQRRSFATRPMNEAHVNAHGTSAAPPNLAPQAQPLPPMASAAPPPPPQAGAGATAAGAPPAPRPPLPASIPLTPMQPQAGAGAAAPAMPGAPVRQPMPSTGAGVTPANASTFTQATAGDTAAPAGNSSSALLKLLATLGHTGTP